MHLSYISVTNPRLLAPCCDKSIVLRWQLGLWPGQERVPALGQEDMTGMLVP